MAYADQSGSTVHTGDTSSSHPRRTLPSNFPKFDQYNPHIHDNERRENERRPNRDLHSDFDDEAFDEEDLPPPAPPSPDSLDDQCNVGGGEAKDDTFDTLDDFGEDTLHALVESDVMLGGMPPLASLRNRAGNDFKIQDCDEPHDDSYDDHLDESYDKEGLDEHGDEMKREEISNDEFTVDDEDDGTMASSFLRGPLMAAKSFAAMNLSANRVDVATTPSTARAQFLMSAVKPPFDARLTIEDTSTMAQHDNFQKQKSDATPHSNHQLTPSTARSSCLSTKKESFKSSISTPPIATPSNLVISTQKPPLGQRNGLARTPSAHRGDFITSPQDSVSTMGSGHTMDHVLYRQNTVTLTAEEQLNTPSGERLKFMNSPQDSLTSHGTGRVFTFRDSESCKESVTARIAGGASITTPHSSKTESGNSKSSMDRLIELGEEQMKQAATASAANSTTKKSFLRKGSRIEPSALHTLDVAKTAAAVATTTGTPSNESSSDRKARIARLEKMQEDLQRDYERRELRKEEAQRERRRLKLAELGSRGVVTQSTLETVRGNNNAEEIVTPSQVRARSASRGRMVDGGVNNATPSTARATSAVRPGRNTIDTLKSAKARDATTPIRARSALKSKRDENNVSSSSQLRLDTNNSTWHVRYDDGVVGKPYAEEKENDMQQNVTEKALPDKATAPTVPEPVSEQNPRKNELSPKTSSSRRQPRSASRSKTTQSKPATRSPSPNRSSNKDAKSDEEVAFEDWKRREGEEWALIKNMRKRQEAALREAEGERERAKAWAQAEIESTKKWIEEQRALIKKDRHKAANAALLATKKAEKMKSTNESNALNAELEELRSQILKMKLEAEEAKTLKEQVRKQEKTILALKSQRSEAASPKGVDEDTNDRRVLKDCTFSKTNKLHSKSTKPKTPQHSSQKDLPVQQTRKKSTPITDLDESNDGYTVEKESTDGCLERNLSFLKNTSNDDQPGMKVNNGGNAIAPEDPGHAVAASHSQRKPYNAADYGPTQSITPSMTPAQGVSSAFSHVNVANTGTPKTTQFFTYQNGTRKEVLSDGTTTVYFTNGDRKRTYANEKKGIVVYYYAATQTTQVTHQDGKQTYYFPNKQIEDHHVDGTKEISYPDGTKRTIFTDGTTDTTFPDGVRVVDHPDGTQRVHQAC